MSVSVPSEGLGPARIDTVGLSVPIVDADPVGATVTVVKADTPDEQRLYRRKLDGGGFVAWGMGASAWVEASLPKRLRGHNLEGVTANEAWEALAGLYDEACQFVEVVGDTPDEIRLPDGPRSGRFEEAKIVRLDVVRDFSGVASAPWLLDGLANVPVTGRARQRRYADAERNRAETLTVGPKAAWAATLYDKAAETAGSDFEADEGSLRFETRLRSDILSGQWARKRGGSVRAVMDLQEDKVQSFGAAMFERVGFDREVEALGRLAEVVFGSDLSATERRNLWAYMTAGIHGADIGLHRNSERKYRRLAEDLGVVLATGGSGATVRLDYASGSELTVVA